MEQTQYNLLFRWFIGLAMDDVVWVPTVFSKNRERLIEHDAVIEFFSRPCKTQPAPINTGFALFPRQLHPPRINSPAIDF